ncbi:MAG TPA: FlgD immunoglobulin-like domain containing protein [Steroidobacteraceae bacterium]|nr:FlgD immunoglobulin-like domain containing protein [Steroidobacteraceae bacterium]
MTTPTVNPLLSSNSSAGSAASSSSPIPANMQISEAGFLQLISTQLQNQDPLNPTDPSEFLSQIEGLSEVSSLQGMQTTLQAQQLTSGAALLGQNVLAPSTTATLASGGSVNGAVQAPTGATNLTVSIASASGATVSSFQVTPQSSGLTPFTWNGTTSTGAAAPAGTYTVSVSATVAGSSQSVSPYIESQVQSVTIDPTTQALDVNTNNGSVPLSSVVSIL